MVDITFPSELGAPLVQGWSETPANVVFRTEMDEGPAKIRRWGTAGAGSINVAYSWDSAQRAIWKAFFKTTIASGSLPFKWLHPIDNEYITVRLKNVPTETLVTYDRYNYTLQLETLP